MFRKVQLKFFSIITGILIAIFIALLFAINIIMNMVMERQSQVVLQQVASGVEYNSETAQFSFTNPDIPPRDHDHDISKTVPPPASTEPPHTETTQITEPVTSAEAPTVAPPTEPPYEEPDYQPEDPPEADQPDDPSPPEPPEEHTDPTDPATDPVPDWGWGWGWWYPWGWGPPPQFPDDPNEDHGGDQNKDPFKDHGGDQNNGQDQRQNDRDAFFHCSTYIKPMAYSDDPPPLNGYSVEDDPIREKPDIRERNDKFNDQVPKSLGSIDFFIIMADSEGQYLAKLNNDDMSDETAQKYADMIFSEKKDRGMADNFQYHREPKKNGVLMVLTDRTAEIDMMNKLKRTTFLVGIISVILLSAASYYLSGLIVRPLKETFDKQKQFISDASHELKTPLTVISTNADVLSGEIGENRWLTYIQDQAARMNVLVNDLLSLTRLENKSSDFVLKEFSLTQAILGTALPFECQAFDAGKNFVVSVDEGISITGSEQHIRQMAGIFIDNALKYSKPKGTVRVALTKEDGKAVLSVYNTGQGVREEEKYRIFERFYRSDESRNRATGGYGLGLSIAKSIIDKHKFKLIVENNEGRSICFVVVM